MTIANQVNFAGLRKRDTYEELINYLLTDQDIVKYPDRRAKQIRESPYLTQLDGEGMRTMEQQQINTMKEEYKATLLREAGFNNPAVGHVQAQAAPQPVDPVDIPVLGTPAAGAPHTPTPIHYGGTYRVR